VMRLTNGAIIGWSFNGCGMSSCEFAGHVLPSQGCVGVHGRDQARYGHVIQHSKTGYEHGSVCRKITEECE
jgi:hypothetical protein